MSARSLHTLAVVAALSVVAGCALQHAANGAPDADVRLQEDGGRDGGTPDAWLAVDGTLDGASDSAPVESGVNNGADGGADGAIDQALVPCIEDPVGSADTLWLMHAGEFSVQASATRLLTADARWILRDRTTYAIVASGAGVYKADLQGEWLALRYDSAIELRHAQDGSVVWNIPVSSSANAQSGIALDGSYVWLGSETALRAFDIETGHELVSHPGDYALHGSAWGAHIVAPAAELRTVNLIDGQRVAERIPLSGTSSLVRVNGGRLSEWSADGRHLLALQSAPLGRNLTVYDGDGNPEVTLPVDPGYPSYGAYGDYVWAGGAQLGVTVRRLGDDSAPQLALGPRLEATFQSGSWVIFSGQDGLGTLVDLSQPTLSSRRVPLGYYSWQFAVWNRVLYFATAEGIHVVPDGAETATRFACPTIKDVALAKDGTFALAMGQGQVLLGELGTRSIRATLPAGRQLSFNRDGTVLGMLDKDARFTMFDARSGALLLKETVPTPRPPNAVYGYDLSADGLRYLVTQCADSCQVQRVDRQGSRDSFPSYQGLSPWWDTTFPRLAPAGTRSAYPSGERLAAVTTTLLDDTNVTGSSPGLPLLWLDDKRLLVNRYVTTWDDFHYAYEGTYVIDAEGSELGRSPAVIDGSRATSLHAGTLVFSRSSGRLYEATGDNTPPVLAVGDDSILGDANDEQLLYVPLQGPNAGALQVRRY